MPLSNMFEAEALGRVNRSGEGIELFDDTLRLIDDLDYRLHEAEATRLKGELLMTMAPTDAIQTEQQFQKSLEVSRAQNAKSWELRAATSLARLWQSQGKRQQAHDLLSPTYDSFTEGFDTADLKNAKALLVELS